MAKEQFADDGANGRQSGRGPGSIPRGGQAWFGQGMCSGHEHDRSSTALGAVGGRRRKSGDAHFTGSVSSRLYSIWRQSRRYLISASLCQGGVKGSAARDPCRGQRRRPYPGRDAASLKARQKPPKRVWRDDQSNQPEAWLRSHTKFNDLSWPRLRIAWQRVRVVKPGPCRQRNFASGLSAPASLRTGFHICSALSPTKAPSGRAAIGPFRRAALRRLLS